MQAGRRIQLLSLLIALLAVLAMAPLQGVINRSRVDLNLTPVEDPFIAMPHDVALALAALGSFRGLAVDYLWIRADRLKEQGKHYEALQLADMICRLQPRFPAVWSFQAWNMAWNISVTTHTPEERWLWVRNGMRLLRDRGIPLNPHAHKLYRDLAWIFLNKMGGAMDDMHMSYKREWAFLMQRLLGPPTPGADPEPARDALKPLAEVPASVEQLRAERPSVTPLLDELERLGVDLSSTFKPDDPQHPLEESFFDRYVRLVSPETLMLDVGVDQAETEVNLEDEQFRGIFTDPDRAEDAAAVLAFLRAKVLRERYKLDPAQMRDVMERYGPLDWRSCQAHAIYWASRGDELVTRGAQDDESRRDLMNTRRFIFFALNDIHQFGRIVFVPNPEQPNRSYYYGLPDLRFIEVLHKAYLELGKDEAELGNNKAAEEFQLGHANFLSSAIRSLYIDGQNAEAQKYFAYLRENYKERDGRTKIIYQMTLHEFVLRDFRERLSSRNAANVAVAAAMLKAWEELALGSTDVYDKRLSWARRIYDFYMKDKLDDMTDRRQLAPFNEMRATALADYLAFGPLHVAYKMRLWRLAPLSIKQRIYDLVRPALVQLAGRSNLDPDRAFPEPEGMEQYRAEHPRVDSEQTDQPAPRIGL